ncbi:coiled-coil domain-containing protein 55, partial [Phenoliferia sp. Uapishka_3]
MDPPKLSFGFKSATVKPGFKPKSKPSLSKPPAFSLGGDDDDDAPAAIPTPSTSSLPRPKVSTATLSKAQKAKQASELALDSSVYEYDEVYDNMKAGSRQAELDKKKDAGERKPKYIARLIETAEVRKRDRVRAEDKMVQREREMEGEEFQDKDAFVTPAYLAQQEELRRIEEEEAKKEAAAKSKKPGGGISNFLQSYLDTTAKEHDAAVAASLAKAPAGPPSFTVEAPPSKTEAQLAAEVSKATGRHIEVNDDGIIIDKRQLLSGGLNIVAKPKPAGASGGAGFSAPIAARIAAEKAATTADGGFVMPGLSAAERGKQSRERHSREVERQMVELDAKRKREAEEQLEQKVVKVAKRNDESKVEELKRKAEERRLKKAEDAKAAAAAEALAPPK